MNTEFLVNICSLLFLCFLTIIYFTKKNALNIENKIYRTMLISILLFLVLQISTKFVYEIAPQYYLKYSNIPISLLSIWFFHFSYYIVYVSNEKNIKFMTFFKNNYKKINIAIVLFLVITSIIQLFLSSTYVYDDNNNVVGIIGSATFYMYGLMVIELFICILSVFLNWKNLNKKKLAPFLAIFLFVLAMLVLLYLINSNPGMGLFFSVITYLMYHTIENPDLKMIAQLELAKEQAEKSNKAKSDFLSSMSHEIRTPLNAIVGLSQMINIEDDMEAMKSDSKDILVASQKLLEIVNGILSINQLEANKVDIDNSDYQTIPVFEDVLKMISIRLGDKPIELKVNYKENIPERLYGDSSKIKQILTNILTNAVKYTEEGFIYFNVDYEIEKDKCNLIISVKDTGRGIKDEQKEKLFTKFNRLEEDNDSDIEGTGLGLAITKSLVELLNGKIEVDSTFGEGSTFKVTIPQKIIN